MREKDQEMVWAEEALRRVQAAPPFVRAGICKLMIKRARERGRTVITSAFLTEIRNKSMLRAGRRIRSFGFETLSMDVFEAAKQRMQKFPRKVKVIEEIRDHLRTRDKRDRGILARFKRHLKKAARTR